MDERSVAEADGGEGGCTKRHRQGVPTPLSHTAFRLVEKRYKLVGQTHREARRHPMPETDFSDVVDFRDTERNTPANRAMIREVGHFHVEGASGGAAAPRQPCYAFTGVPGLYFFPGALTEAEQRHWCRTALTTFADSRVHPNSLSTHASAPRATTRYDRGLRWATLGFGYQWTSRTYERGRYSPFPPPLRAMMERFVQVVEQCCGAGAEAGAPSLAATYQPQTAIINYYPVGSMMMAHQDISEECLDLPLVSVSLGCSCVFLMGTTSRDDPPHAFFLRSGDVVAFTGPSRRAFHAVPRILDDCPAHLGPDADDEATTTTTPEEEALWRAAIQALRINMNVRQVYAEDCAYLFTDDGGGTGAGAAVGPAGRS